MRADDRGRLDGRGAARALVAACHASQVGFGRGERHLSQSARADEVLVLEY